jgi:hypothetical protein
VHFTHKNIALIVIAVLIVGGAFAFAEYRNTHSKKIVYSAPEIQSINDALTPELQNKDSDGDGLKDWEEGLLGTDPHKADTDGDGTSDGKEVALGRNPLVKGPNDKASETAKNGLAAKENLTPTDQLSRDFFARYMVLNQAGLADDPDSQANLIGEVLKDGVVLQKPKVYTAADIKITPDNSVQGIRAYGNLVGGIFASNYNPKTRNELVIAKESVDQEDPAILKEIDPIIVSYKNILTGLLKTPTPASQSETHLMMVNGMSTALFSAESLRKIDKDTLSGIQGSSVWLGAAQTLNKALNSLKTVFAANGISYSPGEGGSFFKMSQ